MINVLRPSLEPHVSLALGMAARPGSTVVLAGAGLSVGAGVPAAWQVQQALLAQAATASGDKPDDVFAWWLERTGTDARYDDVLFATAPTQSGRLDLLRPFFEPTAAERDAGVKVPSAAHRALAEMMRDGVVRIIITLNFDLLIETALRDLGVEPTVVSTAADVAGMEPLHAQRYLVWHLHGDYTNPQMLNTPDELRTYPDVVNDRLDELFDQYGLLILGWSAAWDLALRDALARCESRRYPTTWLDVRELSEAAHQLARQRDAAIVTAPADDWLTQLRDACVVLSARTADPITVVAATAAAKRDLAAARRPIGTHDLLQAEADRIRELPAFDPRTVATGSFPYQQRLPVVEAELELWSALVSTLAYWGTPETDAWWTEHIPRFATIPGLSGSTDAIELLAAPAVMAFHAGGTAAAANQRWDLVARLLNGLITPLHRDGPRVPVTTAVGPAMVYPHALWPSRALFHLLTPVLVDGVGLSSASARDGWERFEYLAYAVALDRFDRKEPANIVRPIPYVRVSDDWTQRRRQVVPVIRSQIDDSASAREVLARELFDNDHDRYTAALDRADEWIAGAVEGVQDGRMRPSVAQFLPSGERYAAIPEDD